MSKKILIDASYQEETRAIVLENGRVQAIDSETLIKKQLKGNIYLAKITRVEASLQAAFIEYGGTRHGFLPFSEIHPDYYNIPVDDKEKLLQSIIAEKNKEEFDDENSDISEDKSENSDDEKEDEEPENSEENGDDNKKKRKPKGRSRKSSQIDNEIYRKYKIQEVIKRGQIILVQVEKEERGNKGASLTTFISLAGKYCVLMPNSLKKGGISRRIVNVKARSKLKSIIASLEIPKETGLIVRTAGY